MARPALPQTPEREQQCLDEPLNIALVEFGSRYMKDKLENQARECDQRLEQDLVPKLIALLRQVDEERHVFEQHKREAVRSLSKQLRLLSSDSTVIDDSIGQLQDVTPRYLTLLPSASSLALPLPVGASAAPSPVALVLTPFRAVSPAGAPQESEISAHEQEAITPAAPPPVVQNQAQSLPLPVASPTSNASDRQARQARQANSEELTGDYAALHRPKRSRTRPPGQNGNLSKRRKPASRSETTGEDATKAPKRVAFPDLEPDECIFGHAERSGFFVIRCEHCSPGIFTDPPFVFNRAFRHFQAHNIEGGVEGLTNEWIFEKYGVQVEGDTMTCKSCRSDHLGDELHIFSPKNPTSGASTSADHGGDDGRKSEKVDENRSPPCPMVREPGRKGQPDHDTDEKKPRRALRKVPRPDYAEMVANKDPWDISDVEDAEEGTLTSINGTRPISYAKRRLTKSGAGLQGGITDSKPFGYMDEPWPRRSAPR